MKSIIFTNVSDKKAKILIFGLPTIVFLLHMSANIYAFLDSKNFIYRFVKMNAVAFGIEGVLMVIFSICGCIYRHFINEPTSRPAKALLATYGIFGACLMLCALIFYDEAQNVYAKTQSHQIKTEQINEAVFDDKYSIVIDGIGFDATEAAYLIDKDYINIDNYEIAVDDTNKQVIFSESN